MLAASSNDNGMLHQELVDFHLPDGLGWAPFPREAPDGGAPRTHGTARCIAPFGWVQTDRAAGEAAEASGLTGCVRT